MQLFFVTAFTAAALSLCSFVLARAQMQRQVYGQLSSVLYTRRLLLEQYVQRERERVATVARSDSEKSAQSIRSALQLEGVSVAGVTVFDEAGNVASVIGERAPIALSIVDKTYVETHFSAKREVLLTVYTPLPTGTLAVSLQPYEFLTVLLASPATEQEASVQLSINNNEDILVLQSNPTDAALRMHYAGNLRKALQNNYAVAGALTGVDSVLEGFDFEGKRVLASYGDIPTLGWGIVVKTSYRRAMSGVVTLSVVLVTVSSLLIILSAVLANIFARKLTEPIISLSGSMSKLGPDNWQLPKSVQSGDEVELLETVASDMAMRLKKTYDHMEEEIADRTEELKKQYIKDRAILQSIDYGIIMTDTEGNITETNSAALDFLQCTKESCSGKHIGDMLNVQIRHSLKDIGHPVLRTLETKKPVRSTPDMRFSILRSDNILIPVLLSCVPLMDGKRLLGAVLVFQDATEQRRVDYLKSEFISLASHQLRTPLSSMQWFLELFGDEKDVSNVQKEYLREMQTAAKRMSGLIDALLHAARLETGSITPHAISVDVVSLLTDLGDELRTMGKDKGVACTVKLPEHKVTMETDSVLLHVVFKNLFSNAVKYTRKGGQVDVAMKEVGDSVEITVKDTGIGIPKKEQNRLFERLFRASNVLKMDTDGNGLGLYITKMIIDSLGGKIAIESEEDKGTTVQLTLPKTLKKKGKK